MSDVFIGRFNHDHPKPHRLELPVTVFPYTAGTLVEPRFVSRDRFAAYFLYVIPFCTLLFGFVLTVMVATAPNMDHAAALPVGICFGFIVLGSIGLGLLSRRRYACGQAESRATKAARIGAWITATYGLAFTERELLRFVVPRYWRYGQYVSRLVRSRVGAASGQFVTYALTNRPDGMWVLYSPEYEREVAQV